MRILFNLKEFRTTEIELAAMAKEASIGFKSPRVAAGINITL